MKIQPAIMSGGAGTRLWPMSRAAKPKQFLPLVSDLSLFQETALRLTGDDFCDPIVICGKAHISIVKEQLSAIDISPAAIITEPMARNTAAVASVASAWTKENNEGALILLTPADHHIAKPKKFQASVAVGAGAARNGSIVTFGIHPTEAHTGFGYIEQGATLDQSVYAVAAFKEKPDAATAQHYIESGRYHWNAGIFLFGADAMLNELNSFAPEIATATQDALAKSTTASSVVSLDATAFAACPSDSIDYAVMEKTSHAAVIAPVDVGWSDIGSWTAIAPMPSGQNQTLVDCNNITIRTDGPFVGAVGLEDMVIVATKDAVLVAPKSRAQEVKTIVEDLKARDRKDLL